MLSMNRRVNYWKEMDPTSLVTLAPVKLHNKALKVLISGAQVESIKIALSVGNKADKHASGMWSTGQSPVLSGTCAHFCRSPPCCLFCAGRKTEKHQAFDARPFQRHYPSKQRPPLQSCHYPH